TEGGTASDRTPPVLLSLRFDPPIVEAGNVTVLTVVASDDLSGVKSINGEIRSPNTLATVPFYSQNGSGGRAFTTPIPLRREAQDGVWYISWIALTDGADNPLLIQAASAAQAPPGGTLRVSSPDSDSTPPELLQVWFEKPVVGDGETNGIRVEA